MNRTPKLHKILVGLDASKSSEDALRSAIALAAEVQGEVEGLFVEDTALISFSELPFATLTGTVSPRQVRLGQAELAEAFRVQASRARRALSAEAEKRGVPWSFQVARGNVGEKLLEAAARADLLILGRAGIRARRRAHGGSLAHRAARSAHLVLIEHEEKRAPSSPVVILALPGPRALRLLEVAALVAAAQGRPLTVLVPPGANEARFLAEGRALLSNWPLAVRWVSASFGGPQAALAEALRAVQGGVLVLDADNPLLDDRRVEELVDSSGCTLLLLR
ncbi:MAG: universal stress protein [Deltaproteobacteria bacterium]|nr:universal stress protein [Deltaproteobacteria bacterium]